MPRGVLYSATSCSVPCVPHCVPHRVPHCAYAAGNQTACPATTSFLIWTNVPFA